MKKGKKYAKPCFAAGMAVMLIFGTLTGCGSAASNKTAEAVPAAGAEYGEYFDYGMTNKLQADNAVAGMEADAAYEEEQPLDSAGTTMDMAVAGTTASAQNTKVTDIKKIIKTYNYNYETEEFDDAFENLKQLVEQYDGYVSSSNLSGTDRRFLSMTVKIPAERCDDFVNSTGNIGTVISQSETAEDVTLQYTDTESRISSLKTEQQRLNELIKNADSLETIVALESRLSEVRYELESYQAQKNQMDSLIAYSTVNLTLREVAYTVEVDDSTMLSRIVTGLKASLRDIKSDAVDFIVWFIVALPYLLIWIAVIIIIVKIIKAFVKKLRKKKQAKAEKREQAEQQAQNQFQTLDQMMQQQEREPSGQEK